MNNSIDRHTFKGKRRLGVINLLDFIIPEDNYIGSDPLYLRYNSVEGVVRQNVDPKYHHFLAQPDYNSEKEEISWFIEDWKETPRLLAELSGPQKERYSKIKDETLKAFWAGADKLFDEERKVMVGALDHTNDDKFIFCADGKVYCVAWGMEPDKLKYESQGTLVHEIPTLQTHKVTFNAGDHGKIDGKEEEVRELVEEYVLTAKDLPQVEAEEGYEFKNWSPDPVGVKVDGARSFTAEYEEKPIEVPPVPPVVPPVPPTEEEEEEIIPLQEFTCTFDPGTNGFAKGLTVLHKLDGDTISPNEVPQISPMNGYTFAGWDTNPEGMRVTRNLTFHALYNKVKLPWYKRFWLWLTGLFGGRRGCLWWLMSLLLAALVFFLILYFMRGCSSCTRHAAVNGVVPVEDTRVTAGGDSVADFGTAKPIDLDDGRLPGGEMVVPPVRNPDGEVPPVVRQPGAPAYLQGRLILFLEDDPKNLDGLAAAFKREFPGDAYNIIGYDKEVGSLFVQIPEAQRDVIRETLNQRIPEYSFIVFDDEVYELNGRASSGDAPAGWHLQAVKAEQGWAITEGDRDVVVAVVDDGIDPSHKMFEGRIVDAYNVYTQDNKLSFGAGHGTHTAALAVGSKDYLSEGAAGIAPNCKLMPVQVADEGMIPLSALISGIMYSVHKKADVVNVSIGPDFQGLNILPVAEQEVIAATRFKNMEKLWNRVCQLARQNNSIIVFAAGNNDIISAIPPENRNGVSITVGAVDRNLYPTEFTNYGPQTDISAPGQGILSAKAGGGLVMYDGTSMAAPIVSGTIALMKSLKRDLNVHQALNALYNSGADVYGYMPPMVQVNLALEAVKRGDFSEPRPRELHPVPDDAIIRNPGQYADDPPSSWTEPLPGVPVVLPVQPGTQPIGAYPGTEPGVGVVTPVGPGGTVPGEGSQPVGPGYGGANPSPGQPAQPAPEQGDDYEALRKMIEMYKRKIAELEKQLPENQNK